MSLLTSSPTKMKVKPPRDPLNRAFYLPRLPREYYQADAVVHWTLAGVIAFHRHCGFCALDKDCHRIVTLMSDGANLPFGCAVIGE
jgi:hypothetical protein